MPRHNKRIRDAIIRNSRPLKQLRLIDAYQRKMPKPDEKIIIRYTDKEKERVEQIKAFCKRHNLTNVEYKHEVEK